MKKRNTTIFAFLLLAAVGMGVGFAELTQNMTIDGNLSVDSGQAQEEFAESVIFTSATQETFKADNDRTVTEDVITFTDTKVTWNITTLAAANDYVIGTFVVENNGEVDATITDVVVPAGENNLYTVESLSESTLKEDASLPCGASLTLKLKVTLLVDPTSAASWDFDISFIARSVANV